MECRDQSGGKISVSKRNDFCPVEQVDLHLMRSEMMLWDTVGMSHHRVVLIKASHTIHFIVDAAGDVLDVLHVGPDEQIP